MLYRDKRSEILAASAQHAVVLSLVKSTSGYQLTDHGACGNMSREHLGILQSGLGFAENQW